MHVIKCLVYIHIMYTMVIFLNKATLVHTTHNQITFLSVKGVSFLLAAGTPVNIFIIIIVSSMPFNHTFIVSKQIDKVVKKTGRRMPLFFPATLRRYWTLY